MELINSVDSFIDRIEKSNFWTFHGGIHPPEQKSLTNNKPIRSIPLPDELIIPLQQHIGEAGKLIVAVGDYVLKGQALTLCTSAMAVPVHAPTSGTITAIKNSTIAHPSGMQELCLFLAPDNEDKWRPRNICNDYTSLDNQQIIEKIIQAGISGMGGAGFPTHIKVNTNSDIHTLIINAAECEPYITADDLLIKEHSSAVVDGINILNQLLTPKHILIGIEDNKPDAINALKKATANNPKIKVCVIPTKYPSGGEKQLIQILTGQEVPQNTLPNSIGIVMQNIATCFAINDAVIHDIPLIKRVVTVTGFALEKPQNIWAPLGTTVGHLLTQCGYKNNNKKHVIMGGPMMGFSLPSPLVPIVKSTNCILAPSEEEISTASYQGDNEVDCIRCGECADVCPSQLLPQEMQWSAKAKDHNLLNDLNLFDCIECGACAYVCPSQIPLVNYYRVAKAEIRQQHILDIKAEKAKSRFEARKLRLERDKKAREEKQKKAAEARKARMSANTPEAKKETSAVAAALARVKAKKAQQQQSTNKNKASPDSAVEVVDAVDDKNEVSAAIARAKAKKLARQTEEKSSPSVIKETKTADKSSEKTQKDAKNKELVGENLKVDESLKTAQQLKKDKIAAAVAKAKAKKDAQNNKASIEPAISAGLEKNNSENNNSVPVSANAQSKVNADNATTTSTPAEDKKARIAAAVAKAKAKKNAEPKTDTVEPAQNSSQSSSKSSGQSSGKSSVKKAPQKAVDNTQEAIETSELLAKNTSSEVAPAIDKKARIAAAVAKAKAKKIAETKAKIKKKNSPLPVDNAVEEIEETVEKPLDNSSNNNDTAVTDKQARIAAAVAKAKAKKQQRSESL